MKKVITMMSIIACLLLFNGCSSSNTLGEESAYGENVNQLEDVTIELNKDTYLPQGDTFELKVFNHSDREITYGVPYELEMLHEGKWRKVETDEDIAFIMIAYILHPDEESVDEISLEYYEPLEEGRYRIIRMIEEEPLAAEFTVR